MVCIRLETRRCFVTKTERSGGGAAHLPGRQPRNSVGCCCFLVLNLARNVVSNEQPGNDVIQLIRPTTLCRLSLLQCMRGSSQNSKKS